MKAIVCGGGTGGHIYPALSIAEGLRQQGAEVLYMGAHASREEKQAALAGFPFRGVEAKGLHKHFPGIIREVAANLRGVSQAKAVIREFAPDIVIGTGGYASAPVVMAAQKLGLPTVLHEQNAFPGRANRLLAKKAEAVCLTFPEAAKMLPHEDRLHLTGLPVRQDILDVSREDARRFFDIPADDTHPTLLVTGGSLGAASLNRAAAACMEQLLAADLRVIMICGESSYMALRQQMPDHPRLILRPYINEMQFALKLADLAVARAGASFLSEAACLGLPAILVPYPLAANDHQRHNAFSCRDAGAVTVLEDGDLSGEVLLDAVLPLIRNAERLATMGAAAKTLAHPDATEKILHVIETVL